MCIRDRSIEADDGKININTADINKLKEIPGIGDVKANSIIIYLSLIHILNDFEFEYIL